MFRKCLKSKIKMFKYSKEQSEFLKQHVKNTSNKELTAMFNNQFGTNLTVRKIKAYKGNHNLSSGITGRFEKGQVSWNKDKKMSKYQYEKCKNTMFKKGNKSFNCDPIGTEKWKSSHKGRDDMGFLYVKVADGKRQHNWKQKHRLIWEEKHGPIPPGYKLIFLDGDRTHIELDNLVLVENAEMLILNRKNLIFPDQEITKTGVEVARVIYKTNKAIKKVKDVKRRK